MCPHHCADLGWPVTVRHASKLPHDGSGFSTDSSAHPPPLAQLGRTHDPRTPLARRRLGAATAVPVPMRSGYPVVQSGSETRGAAVFLVAFTDPANVTCAVFRHHSAQLLATGLLTVHGLPPPDVIVGIVPEEQVRVVLLWHACCSVALATQKRVERALEPTSFMQPQILGRARCPPTPTYGVCAIDYGSDGGRGGGGRNVWDTTRYEITYSHARPPDSSA